MLPDIVGVLFPPQLGVIGQDNVARVLLVGNEEGLAVEGVGRCHVHPTKVLPIQVVLPLLGEKI